MDFLVKNNVILNSGFLTYTFTKGLILYIYKFKNKKATVYFFSADTCRFIRILFKLEQRFNIVCSFGARILREIADTYVSFYFKNK